MPAFPFENVVDPTGAGDTFAGGLAGYLASQPDRPVDHELLATATAYGTAVASFNVEEFGTERVARLTVGEVNNRFEQLHVMTQFSQPFFEEKVA
jgi:sugar/nucleoside kinase (ribokinase family)